MKLFLSFFSFLIILNYGHSQKPSFSLDSSKNDTNKTAYAYSNFKGLPLKANRHFKLETPTATWTSIDISPDGKTIIFDMMGDLYTAPFSGGKPTQITKGLAYDNHPRFSPDGKQILFISDRNGSDNLWLIDLEKKDTFSLTNDVNENYPNASFTPDGDYIVYSKGRRNMKLYLIHRKGGSGTGLIEEPRNLKIIDPVVSPDGRYIYFSQRVGAWNYNAMLPQYALGRYDRQTGKSSTIATKYGSAFTPTLSKDGKWLVYGSRFEDKTGLIKRNLITGEESWLAFPVQRDEQESIAPMGVLPAMCFTPDNQYLIASYGGKINKINIDNGQNEVIPIDFNGEIEVGPKVRFNYPIKDTNIRFATQIRDGVPSPDGKSLAFTVLNRLYLMDYPNGIPYRITKNDFTEAGPAWHPNGQKIYFVVWNNDGGSIFEYDLKTNVTTPLTKEKGLYLNLAVNPAGTRLAFTKTPIAKFKEEYGPVYDNREDVLQWLDLADLSVHKISDADGLYNTHFTTNEPNRIYYNKNGQLISLQWDGNDEKIHFEISGITTFGSVHKTLGKPDNLNCILPDHLDEDDAAAGEITKPSLADIITINPNGKSCLAQVNNNIYYIVLPQTGKLEKISVANPNSSQFPARLLTEFGGEFASWESDGKKIHYSLGAAHIVYNVEQAQQFEDSIAQAKKDDEQKKKLAALNNDTTKKDSSQQVKAPEKTPKYKSIETWVKVPIPFDIPASAILIKNARIITMKGDEIIAKGDIYIENNRIKGVGKINSKIISNNAKIVDASGKTVIPGLVDVHAHMWPNWFIHKNQIWIYAANLAYGVTTTRDPQTATTDVLTYSDMVNAGMMVGPRIYSTGPGVGFWYYNVKDSNQAEDILKQYSKYFDTKYIKMYLTGNRKQRQWIIQAAKNQQLMPTTEGGLDFKLNMTNLLDGYPGHEHAIPIFPLYPDVLKTIAYTKMIVTPTLLVSYGGPWAENYFYETMNPYNDQKLQYFSAYEELAQKSRRRSSWFLPEEHVFQKHAQSMKNLINTGGLVGIGSHGQLQGLGFHWELWAMQSGGMTPLNALKTATIFGAEGLGLDKDLGSIEIGKLADLLILDKNPLDDIHHSNSIKYVIKNGRMYDASNLDEIYPNNKKLIRSEWNYQKPTKNTSVAE